MSILVKKIDLILSSLEAVNLKMESIGAVVKSLEGNLNKVHSRVETLEQHQKKSKVAINEMQDVLQALNTIVEESKTAGDGVKKYCDDKYRSCRTNYYTQRFTNGAKISGFTVLKNCLRERKMPALLFEDSLSRFSVSSQTKFNKLSSNGCIEWGKQTKTEGHDR